jgi:hypothetical protein
MNYQQWRRRERIFGALGFTLTIVVAVLGYLVATRVFGL